MAGSPTAAARRGRPAFAFGLLLLPFLVAGCSGTRFGEALSRSFSSPSAPPGDALPGSPAATGVSSQPGSPPAGAAGAASSRQAGAAATASAPSPTAASGTKASNPAAASPSKGPTPASGAGSGSPSSPASAVARPSSPAPTNPAPYRVTIRLPQADPSAPAEVVTEALRAAGVPFEVETIERMGGAAAPVPVSPAQPVVPAAPQVRPAPAPR